MLFMQSTPDVISTRDRLVFAMIQALRSKGFHGVGLSEILSSAQAPKGVLYHHFPGGKSDLAVVAIQTVVNQITDGLNTVVKRSGNTAQALTAWMGSAQKRLLSSGFESGCPLATIALESTPDDAEIRAALADGFATIRSSLATALQDAGIEPKQARALAALVVSAYEGALVQARVAGNVEVMRDTTQALVGLIQSHLPDQSE
jgi:TetR/AcrR family transcriptional repressor of lmrAB and yxaGH operons